MHNTQILPNTRSQSLSSPFCGSPSSNSSNPSLVFCSLPFCASSSSSDSTKPFANSGSPFSGLALSSFLGSFKIGSGSSKPNSIPAAGITKPSSLGSGTATSIFSTIITTNSILAAAAAVSTITATVASSTPPTVSSPSFSIDLSGLSFSLPTKSSATSQAQSTALLGNGSPPSCFCS